MVADPVLAALDLPDQRPRHPSEFDRRLKTALAERPRTFLVDEAQWLNGEAFEYFRYLWDDPSTQLAVIFVGGEGCHTVLRREAMLSSRIFIWHFTRLTSGEVLETIPLFHPIWADADSDDITFADSRAAHGNFRAWARLTAHTRTALARTGRTRVDQGMLRWAFSQPGRLTVGTTAGEALGERRGGGQPAVEGWSSRRRRGSARCWRR
ncbi:AAA family ATPase [Streptomyces sp. NPDC048419]|uniref:AAA family ATPase n=1 Tax=Streptomyces sp. NPDC048419 TaxID=3365547 RepID=UPI0037118137